MRTAWAGAKFLEVNKLYAGTREGLIESMHCRGFAGAYLAAAALALQAKSTRSDPVRYKIVSPDQLSKPQYRMGPAALSMVFSILARGPAQSIAI